MAETTTKTNKQSNNYLENRLTHGFGRDSALCTSHAFLCCLFPLPAKLQRQTRHLCRCTARGRSGVFDKVRRLVHTSSETPTKSSHFFCGVQKTTIGSHEFIRLLETIFNANGQIHTPSRGVYFQVLEVHSHQFKLCGRGWFVSLGEMVCFLMRNHFTLSHFYQSKTDTVNPSEV